MTTVSSRTAKPSFSPANPLSRARRQLLELMQRVNFARIEGLTVRGGEPVFDTSSPARVVLEVKFSAENGPRTESGKTPVALKQQVVDLFAFLDRSPDTTIESLTVKHGLPFGMHVETKV